MSKNAGGAKELREVIDRLTVLQLQGTEFCQRVA